MTSTQLREKFQTIESKILSSNLAKFYSNGILTTADMTEDDFKLLADIEGSSFVGNKKLYGDYISIRQSFFDLIHRVEETERRQAEKEAEDKAMLPKIAELKAKRKAAELYNELVTYWADDKNWIYQRDSLKAAKRLVDEEVKKHGIWKAYILMTS